ncbi:hypothetical protein [Streptomyces sp. NBC_01408]|uniref:hypothetical protein n=1 Tax=Streptomyces sp. NBC_01408 TaxID=2903855 RepID=UPI0022548DB0|nr:hypothetical protein [Streptomyces sp. NBC_01408]MCX4692294.1 hypothetical protein [Streptomyces sp. NBC_01408]
MDMISFNDAVDGDEQTETPRQGPLWRHALWSVAVTACGLGLGWAASVFRLGPPEYGIPSAAPGFPWALLAACGAAGLVAAALLRGTAARIPVYAPTRVGFVLVFLGTRLALGFRPEPAPLAAAAGAAVLASAAYCGYAAWTHHRLTACGQAQRCPGKA